MMELKLSDIGKKLLYAITKEMSKEQVLENFITIMMILGFSPIHNIQNTDGINSGPVLPENEQVKYEPSF